MVRHEEESVADVENRALMEHFVAGTTARCAAELVVIIAKKAVPYSVFCSDAFSSRDALDVAGFKRLRINHAERFAEKKNHINGIEKFQARRSASASVQLNPENESADRHSLSDHGCARAPLTILPARF